MNVSDENVPMFSANYTLDPFVDYMVDELHPYYGFRGKFSPELIQRYEHWCSFFLDNFTEENHGFCNQDQRAWFDREYIQLANEFRQLGLVFRLDLWW